MANDNSLRRIDSIPPLRLEIPEAAAALRISRSQLYLRIRAGEIKVQRDGRRTLITTAELDRYVARQPLSQAVA